MNEPGSAARKRTLVNPESPALVIASDIAPSNTTAKIIHRKK
jgi:hypothetical protein